MQKTLKQAPFLMIRFFAVRQKRLGNQRAPQLFIF
jgi:hypothetical protein